MIGGFADEHFFLSNFYRQAIEWRGRVWHTTEHAFQAGKTQDITKQEQIRKASSPGEAKRLGKPPEKGGIVDDLREDWEDVKGDLMFSINVLKFAHSTLGVPLRETAPHELVEGNTWHDNEWGDCICGRPACQGEGKNMLGITLMRIRAVLL